jgi:hypothetical protein
MKKLILSFVFLITLACPSLADFLSDNKKVLDSSSHATLSNSSDLLSDNKEVLSSNALQSHELVNISIGHEISGYLYKEPGVMKLNGIKYGFCANIDNIDVREDASFFFAVQFRYMKGNVGYDGCVQDFGTEKRTSLKYSGGIPDLYFELRGLLGLTLESGTCSKWHPFSGIGKRGLFNGLAVKPPHGYNRYSSYLYLPVGVLFEYYCKEGLSFDICGEFDWMFYGLQLSYLKGTTAPPLQNEQANGYGLRLSGKVSKKGKNVKFFAGPFVGYWNIPQSNIVSTDLCDKDGKIIWKHFTEPKNYTVEAGIKLGISF